MLVAVGVKENFCVVNILCNIFKEFRPSLKRV